MVAELDIDVYPLRSWRSQRLPEGLQDSVVLAETVGAKVLQQRSIVFMCTMLL